MIAGKDLHTLTGQCLCGDVSLSGLGRANRCYVCHCTDCQKRSGSSFIMTVPVEADSFAVAGETIAVVQRRGEAPPAYVHFCPSCLCRLFTVSPSWPGFIMLRGGSLDQAADLLPSVHIWTRSKQSWLELPNGVRTIATQPSDASAWRGLLR